MNFNENSIIAELNPFVLLFALLLAAGISAFSAWKYRDTNDFKKSLKLAMLLIVICSILLYFLGIPWFLIIGYVLCTFIFTSWFSNYFFYK